MEGSRIRIFLVLHVLFILSICNFAQAANTSSQHDGDIKSATRLDNSNFWNQSQPFEETQSLLPLKLPGAPYLAKVNDLNINRIRMKLAKYPTYAGYDTLAKRYLQLNCFQDAAAAFRQEAAMYQTAGLRDAAIILRNRAERYDTHIQLFLQRDATSTEERKLNSGATLEPPIGCYIGAFIDRDQHLPRVFQGDNWQWHRYPNDFARVVGKSHSVYFMYLNYKKGVPIKWLKLCKQQNVIPQIAWEPDSLNEVQDNSHLRNFAKALGALNWPVFVRFASEMNGYWTPYHNNPKLYREKFRLIHNVLHRYSSKVATIWCVDGSSEKNMDAYYPGDNACDWVGINLYSTPFLDNNRTRTAFLDSPLQQLDPVYSKYSARKPIAICEYGASHMGAVDHVLRTNFAIEKMSQLYSALPVLYPRVKMIDWYDSDNLKNAPPGRRLNNYNLTATPTILSAYQKLIHSSYFIGNPESSRSSEIQLPLPVTSGQQLPEYAKFVIWVKSYTAEPTVVLQIGNKIVYAGRQMGAHHVSIDLTRFPMGRTTITVFVYDKNNRFVTKYSQPVSLSSQYANSEMG
jgi:hypothetical protein